MFFVKVVSGRGWSVEEICSLEVKSVGPMHSPLAGSKI